MVIGTLAYRTKTGLGYQVADYIEHLGIQKILVVDLSDLNGMPLTDWYPGAPTSKGYPTDADLDSFLDGVDVVVLAETPLNYNLYSKARDRGIKTVVVINPEFYDHIKNPHYPMPDRIILPSVWMIEEITSHAERRGTSVTQIHHPVDRAKFPFRLRSGSTALHIAGKPAANDRNGTYDFLNAYPQGTVATQSDDLAYNLRRQYRHSTIYKGISEAKTMYDLGDFLVLPRKYGGNCLVLNEALSSGLPVIMTNISPNNHLLPQEWLVGAKHAGYFEPRTRVDLWEADPIELAGKIAWMQVNIEEQSKLADKLADTISWDTLLPRWRDALCVWE